MEATLTRKSAAAPAAFLEKLYDILEDVSLESYISWQPDGQSFLIRDVNSVSELVLPHYFKHNNIQSFVRQLNMYSFTKTRHDSNYREFRQPLFQRGRRDLLSLIKRKTQGSSEKNAIMKRKLGTREIEIECKCVAATTDEESEDKLSCDGVDDDVSEEVSSSSSCSSDNEVFDGSSPRNKELEEIKSYMRNLESQMWSLNEKYGVLSASYGVLREKFESYQSNHSPNLSSLSRVPDNRMRNIPAFQGGGAEQGGNIIRMISVDSQSQRTDKEYAPIMKEYNQNNLIAENEIQERKKRKQTSSFLGLGLDAMVAAASLHSENTEEHSSLRSSLEDLLNAANFNASDSTHTSTHSSTHTSAQIKIE